MAPPRVGAVETVRHGWVLEELEGITNRVWLVQSGVCPEHLEE